MNTVLIGNLVSGVGCLIMVAIGLLRKNSHILIAQCFQCGFMGVGNLILGGVNGFIANVVSIGRNLIFVKCRTTTALKVGFIGLQLLLSLGSMDDGLICWLPIVATALFTWFLDTKSPLTLKKVILTTQVMWLAYDIYYRNYVTVTFDVMTMVSNFIGYRMIKKTE
ncbi:MAG: YgjV family protein [Oscillospiraceae bacterium]|nr:YgjV family protein [Oscillospiraceae bacterium]